MSESRTFYVYALKDPVPGRAQTFYVGKGTGARRYDHLIKSSDRRTSKRIAEVRAGGREPIVVVLVDLLTEADALRIEAELIAAFGTQDNGGPLSNSVLPTGRAGRQRGELAIPDGVREKAAIGLQLLKDAILELAQANPSGITNADASQTLGLQSDYAGKSINYLGYSLLGLLMREGKMRRERPGARHIAQVT
jgi:uncharacterized protein